MPRTEEFYHDHLYDYLTDYYWVYEEDLEWYPNPAPNQWKFRVPNHKAITLLTCNDDGEVVEELLW